MDGRRHEELSDELLGREIEAALDVEPSPEFLVRVRARVARERIDESWAWLSGWRWAGAALAIAAVAVAGLWMVRQPGSAPPDGQSVNASRDLKPGPPDAGVTVPANREPEIPSRESAPEVAASATVSKPVIPPRDVQVPEPLFAPSDVLISQDEAAALRQLFAAIGSRRLETAVLPDLVAALQPPVPIEDIVLEPITVSPLASLEGE
jgi:hypothetical protein